MNKPIVVLCFALTSVSLQAQSDRAYERASDHARFKRTSAQTAPIAVPEPSTVWLLSLGAGVLLARRQMKG